MQTQSIMPMREYWQDIDKSTHSSTKNNPAKKNLSSDMRITGDSKPGVPSEKMPPDESNATKGVIRLLQEGHFKGVADVRLRINFMDEINALEKEALPALAKQEVGDVIASVKNIVDEFIANSEVSDDTKTEIAQLQEKFSSDVTTALDALQAEEVLSADKVTEIVTTNFNTFVESLKAILSSTGVQTPDGAETGNTPEPAPGPATESPFDTFFDSLDSVFTDKLGELANNINNFSVLPPLCEPEGNGKAYDKFFAIYQDLMRNDNTSSESAETVAVDIYM